MENHTAHLLKSRHRGVICRFSTLIGTLFGTEGDVMRTLYQRCPEALLAAVNTALADLVILPSAVLAQEEGPFQPPFFTSAHRLPSSGGFFCGAALSGNFRPAHSRLASSRRSMMDGFLSGAIFAAASFALSNSSPRRPLLITPSIMP